MTDWKERQLTCPRCGGVGYVRSQARHADGRGAHAWVARCECQPATMEEIAEAAEQEEGR